MSVAPVIGEAGVYCTWMSTRSLDGACSEILGPGLLGQNDLQIVLFVLRRDGLDYEALTTYTPYDATA